MSDLLDDLLADGFGHWLAGLIDGEGSFQISPNRPGFSCRLTVALRDDDTQTLAEVERRTGLGRLTNQARGHGTNRKPVAIWRVQRQHECEALIEILAEFPMRSKKARDLAVWSEAVRAMGAMPPANGRPRDWSEVAALKERLSDVRAHPSVRLAGVAGGS